MAEVLCLTALASARIFFIGGFIDEVIVVTNDAGDGLRWWLENDEGAR
jgi:hypothetical protein